VNGLVVVPMSVKGACRFVTAHHRHHRPPPGGLFACAARTMDTEICAVGIAARPVARMLDDGWTVEITRLASTGARNACSMVYGALCRAAQAIGYRLAITYTLESEEGASVRAAGFQRVHTTEGGSWDRPSRRRSDKHPTVPKVLWHRRLAS
jgi:hypothetical protein